MSPFVDRMMRAAKLDVHLYEEVEADQNAMGQAMGVVILASLAGGIGLIDDSGLKGMALGTIGTLVGWFLWAFLTFIIGTKLLPEPQTKSDYGEMLRTTGFSSAPGVLRIFGIIPGLGGLIMFLAACWMLVAMVIAVRQALDYESTWRALGVCAIGWVIQGAILAVFVNQAGGPEVFLKH